MLKSLVLLVLGVAGGAVVALAVRIVSDSDSADSSASLELSTDYSPGAAAASADVTERLAIYLSVAAETDLARLEARLASVAVLPASPARDAEIDALLARIADIAPERAVASALANALDTVFVADVLVYLAETDRAGALAALSSLDGSIRRREVALALLDGFGDDADGLAQVASPLPESERDALRVEWYARRAAFDPVGAFRDAQGIVDARLQRSVLIEIAEVWAAQDPEGALALADRVPAAIQPDFRATVVHHWARLDAAGFLAHMEQSPPEMSVMVNGLRDLAAYSPERVLRITDRLPDQQPRGVRAIALSAIADIDPARAIGLAEAMAPGLGRDMALSVVGQAIARRDPDRALAWAQGVSPPSRDLMTQIAIGIAQTDVERALSLMDEPPPGVDPQLIAMYIGTLSVVRDPAQAEDLADRLVSRESARSRSVLGNLVSKWSLIDPVGALDWVVAHDTRLDSTVFGTMAQALAGQDAALAAGYVEQIPTAYRAPWIIGIAGSYGLSDPDAALTWVEQFRGQEFFDDAFLRVVVASARTDPVAAANLLSQSNAGVQLGAAQQVALELSRQDPAAAASWAMSLGDTRARASALETAVASWASADLGSAREFAVDVERSADRDQALSAIVFQSSLVGEFDRELLDAFSSDAVVQQVLQRSLPALARADESLAIELLDLVTDDATRSEIERQILQARSR